MSNVELKVFNAAINTLEVGGVFWVGRQTTVQSVSEDRVDEVKAHKLLEIVEETGDSNSAITSTSLNKLNKPELQELATSMGIEPEQTVDELKAAILEHEGES